MNLSFEWLVASEEEEELCQSQRESAAPFFFLSLFLFVLFCMLSSCKAEHWEEVILMAPPALSCEGFASDECVIFVCRH